MRKPTKRLILVLIIISAIACYALGYGGGVVGFAVLGIIWELAFTVGVLRNFPDTSSSDKTNRH